MNTRQHSSREFEAELQGVKNAILAMGGRAEHSLGDAINALVNRDTELAQRTIAADKDT
ncbi:MAG: hypothetical protein FD129_2539, partial [bacterium]